MCAVDDADPWDVCRANERTAVKPHRCGDCGRWIEKGERYHWLTGLYDGRWSTHKTCAHCHAAGWWLNAVCGGYLMEQIGTELLEHWGEGYRDLVIGRLIVGHRRKWRRWGGSLMPVPKARRIVWSASRSSYYDDRQILRYEPLVAAA